MFVQNHMTPSPVTIAPDTAVEEALSLMHRRKCRHLPVVEEGHLVGLVTKRILLQALSPGSGGEHVGQDPSLTAKQVMVSRPVTVTPDCPVEEAALLMRDHKIGSLPVLEGGRLVGIITQTDMVEALVRFFGLRHASTRVVVETHNRAGALSEITALIHQRHIPILGIACLYLDGGRIQTVVRLATTNPAPVITALVEKGLNVRL
ncbi:MAG TPA: CBS and ACT domain-containing protein [Spirochaetia bacterium]|nr:CBS and ACT domain-containing protein [Spirochaetia bacterium]